MSSILDLNIQEQRIIVEASDHYRPIIEDPHHVLNKHVMKIHVADKMKFNKIKFSYIKYIKGRPNPDDRVADFEFRDKRGLPDFDKLERLIEMRKTREEKQTELDDEINIKNLCEKHNVKYHGPLGRD